jgi:hypothetical protein
MQQRDDDVDPVAALTRRCGGVGVMSTRRNGSVDPDLLLALYRRRGRRAKEEAKMDVAAGAIRIGCVSWISGAASFRVVVIRLRREGGAGWGRRGGRGAAQR